MFIIHAIKSEKVFRDRYNPLESLNENEFMELYRLRKSTVIDLLKMGNGQITITKSSHSIPPAIQLCSTLNILSTGATLRKTGELLGFGNQTVHKFFWNIIDQLNNLADVFIRFPNPDHLNTVAAQFYKLGHIPNVIGCIDGSFIPIKRPPINENIFVCRKGYHALNVLVVNKVDLSFSYINARFPGSAHDAYIYHMSLIRDLLLQHKYSSSI